MRIPPESVIADRAEIGAAVVPIIVPRPDRAIEPIAARGEQARRRGDDAVTARPIEEIGRADVRPPVTTAHDGHRHLLKKKETTAQLVTNGGDEGRRRMTMAMAND